MIDLEGGRGIDCNCVFFSALPEERKNIELGFRLAALAKREPEGILNSLCGICVRQRLIDEAIAEEINKLILSAYETVVSIK